MGTFCILVSALLIFATSVKDTKANEDEHEGYFKGGPSIQPTHFNVYFVSWINNQPYYIQPKEYGNMSRYGPSSGIVPHIIKKNFRQYLKKLSTTARVNDIDGDDIHFNFIDDPKYHLKSEEELLQMVGETEKEVAFQRFNRTTNSTDIFIVTSTKQHKNSQVFQIFQPMETRKGLVIVRTADILLLMRLFEGTKNCAGVLFFALVCAINLSALIWLIEHKGNPEFESTFGTGLWTTLWFCFVTMTTVGYGDKVPRHFMSRLFCLFWMLFGIVLTAVILTSVMEAVQSDYVKPEMNVGVPNGSLEKYTVSSKLSANPKVYKTVDKMIAALQAKEVDAALLDENIAAYFLGNLETEYEDLKIESELEMPALVNAYALNNPASTGLIFDFNNDNKKPSPMMIAESRAIYLSTYEVHPYYARTVAEFFNKQDDGLVLYLTITAGLFIFIGIVCELIPFLRKKHTQLKIDERKREKQNKLEMSSQLQKIKELEKQFKDIIEKLHQHTELNSKGEVKTTVIKNNLFQG